MLLVKTVVKQHDNSPISTFNCPDNIRSVVGMMKFSKHYKHTGSDSDRAKIKGRKALNV